jgi:transposase
MNKRIAPRENSIKGIGFLQGERVEVGIDVHKRTYSVTLWSEPREAVVSRWTQPADPAGLIQSMAAYEERVRRVVYEAGPTGYGLVRALRARGFEADVIAPSRTPKSTGQEAKSDRLDSRKLAMWSAKGLLKPVRVPTEEEEGDRQVFRTRDDAVAKRRRVKQQIKSFLLQHGIPEPDGLRTWARKGIEALRNMKLSAQLRFSLDFLLADLDHYNSQVKKADAALKSLASTPRHKKFSDALKTVKGVGPVTAMAMRTELIAPDRFNDGRQVAAMAGLAPLVSRTGPTTRPGPLMKCGNARLRKALIEAAWRWVAQDPWAAQRYGQLVRNTGDKKKAIAGMARRLVIILWRISVTGEPYRPRPLEESAPPRSPSARKRRQPGLPDKTIHRKRAPSTTRQRPLSVQPPR